MAARRKAVGPPRVSSRKVAGPPSQVLEVLGYGIGALLDLATPAEVKEVERALEGIPPAKHKAAVRVWRALLKRRKARKPDLFPAPDRLRAFQQLARRRK